MKNSFLKHTALWLTVVAAFIIIICLGMMFLFSSILERYTGMPTAAAVLKKSYDNKGKKVWFSPKNVVSHYVKPDLDMVASLKSSRRGYTADQ